MTLYEGLAGLAVGAIGGFFSGMLGVTSGGLLVPLGVLLLGLDQHAAQGVSLVAQVFPTSLSGFREYQQKGHGTARRAPLLIALGFLVGGTVGAILASRIASTALQWIFVSYLIALLCILVSRPASAHQTHGGEPRAEGGRMTIGYLAVGLAAGISSGVLGIGGGLAITILGLAVLRLSQHQAQALSLLVTALPVTLPSAWTYVRLGYQLPVMAIVGIVPGLWIGTLVGARQAAHLSAQMLRSTLIALLVTTAALLAWRAAAQTFGWPR